MAFVLAFAGGAILTMLSDTMVPEAHKYGGRAVRLLATTGFAVAILIVALENTYSGNRAGPAHAGRGRA